MSKEDLQQVIDDFSDDNLSRFFRRSCDDYAENPEDLSQYDEEGKITGFHKLKEIDFGNTERLLVTTARVNTELTERSGKKAQYEKAKKILKEAGIYDAGFFIFYDDSGSFRFSLIYGQAEGTKKSWSNFLRFTYFVNSDQTNITFKKRVGECGFTSLETIKDAFSVEKVTKDFYRQIADWYFWAVKNVRFPEAAENEKDGRNIAVIRLITRLIFIWFMKERKLVSPDLFDKNKMSALLKSLKADETTYYKAILQNLFFATLNTKIEDRKFRFTGSFQGKNTDYMDHGIYRYEDYFNNQEDTLTVFKDIPFLNGGLFDCLDWSAKESGTGKEARFDGFSDKEVGLKMPNYLFFSEEREADLNKDYGTKNRTYRVQGLLNILSAYNFTIDENDPNDQEVALDPELLGKVFENLLASFNPETATTARKATGSYYTPREIVDYMVTQSLKQYYRTHLDEIDDIDSKLDELLSPITDEATNPFGEADSKRVVQLTEALRIVDPAVGSGAFPMGILNKLVSVLSRIDPDNKLWQEAQLRAVDDVPDPLLKQKLVKQINEQFAEKNSNYGRKLYLIQKCIYGVDIQQIAIEIAKLRFFIALLVDERIDKTKPNWGIEPLPNLDFKLMQGNSLISEFIGVNLDAEDSDAPAKLMKDETDELITSYQDKKSQYQYEPDQKKKETLKSEIEKLIEQIFESKLKTQKAEYYNKLKNIERKYATIPDIEQKNDAIKKDTETLNRNYKFDLAQAEKQLKEFTAGLKVKPFFAWKLYFAEVFHEKGGFDIVIANPPYISHDKLDSKQYLQKRFKCFEPFADLYCYFLELAVNILNSKGSLCYITSNSYIKAKYGAPLRNILTKQAVLLELINIEDYQVFEASIVNTAIIIVQRKHDSQERKCLVVSASNKDGTDFTRFISQNSQFYSQSDFLAEPWSLTSLDKLHVVRKMESAGKTLDSLKTKIRLGIATGFNEAFLLDETTKAELLKKDAKNAALIKPVLRGRDIFRFGYFSEKQYLLLTKNGINVPRDYPNYIRIFRLIW
jgi:adenine-specific DNA-methyltransferase